MVFINCRYLYDLVQKHMAARLFRSEFDSIISLGLENTVTHSRNSFSHSPLRRGQAVRRLLNNDVMKSPCPYLYMYIYLLVRLQSISFQS